MTFGTRTTRAAALAALLVLLAVSPAPADSGMAGTWKGLMIIREAQFELDLILDIERQGESWTGYLSVPTRGVVRRPVEELAVAGPSLSFLYKDEAGGSRFSGKMDADGRRIEGQIAEKEFVYPTRFERLDSAPPPPNAPQVQTVGEDGAELKRLFNQHKDATRLVMLISPTCHQCKVSTRMVQRYVLDKISSERLRVFVVWEPVFRKDSAELAAASAALLNDPRVTHLWSPEQFTGRALQEAFGPASSPVWDAFFVFPPLAEWKDLPPAPSLSQSGRPHVPLWLRFNANLLFKEISGQLAKAP